MAIANVSVTSLFTSASAWSSAHMWLMLTLTNSDLKKQRIKLCRNILNNREDGGGGSCPPGGPRTTEVQQDINTTSHECQIREGAWLTLCSSWWLKSRGRRKILTGIVSNSTKGNASAAAVAMTSHRRDRQISWTRVNRCILRLRTCRDKTTSSPNRAKQNQEGRG